MGVLRVKVNGQWVDVVGSNAAFTNGPLASRPAASTANGGQRYFATDNLTEYMSDGGGWIVMNEPANNSFHPVVTSYSGTITTLGTVSFVYSRSNTFIDWHAVINIVTNGSAGVNLQMTLPRPSWSGQHPIGSGRESNVFGYILSVTASGLGNSNQCQIQTYGNGWPGGDGTKIELSGRYRMADRYG